VTGRHRLLRSLPVVGLVLACAGTGTVAAFSAATSSSGSTITAGTVSIADNDAGAAVVPLPAASPGQSSTGCIAVTYNGTLSAGVRLFATLGGSLAPHLTLTVTRGTQATPSFNSCAGFTADATDYVGAGAGVVFSGLLSAFPTSWASGIADAPGSPETWATGERHVYRFVVTLGGSLAAQGLSQTAAFTWEARNL
jgi:predicted ribosomally synthesized peptide with SipW-like signal peptide